MLLAGFCYANVLYHDGIMSNQWIMTIARRGGGMSIYWLHDHSTDVNIAIYRDIDLYCIDADIQP